MKILENFFVNAILASAELCYWIERIAKLIGAALVAPLALIWKYTVASAVFLIVGGVVAILIYGGDLEFPRFVICSYLGASAGFMAHMVERRNF